MRKPERGDIGAVDQRGCFRRGQWLRHRMRQFRRGHGADRVVLAVAAPLEEFVEHAKRAQSPRQAPAADPLAPPRREEGANVARRQREELLHVRQFAALTREEGEELRDVAAIGFRRVRRELALDREIGEPVLDRLTEIGRPLDPRRF
jgi:hypothetical protein